MKEKEIETMDELNVQVLDEDAIFGIISEEESKESDDDAQSSEN